MQVRAGGVLAQEVRDCGLAMRQEVGKAFGDFRRVGPNSQANLGGAIDPPRAEMARHGVGARTVPYWSWHLGGRSVTLVEQIWR